MPCYAPLAAFRGEKGPSGKREITFDRKSSFSGVRLRIPCGQCVGCRLEKGRQWSMRMMHEFRTGGNTGSFVTLTYDDDHVPYWNTLVKADFQNFMKKLRHRLGDGIRFYGCGEYGEQNGRPHYHVCLLNRDFDDKRVIKKSASGETLYSSAVLDQCWPFGFALAGDVSFDSCSYVAGYVIKKITGPVADWHYGGRLPEFALMSRRPGLGDEYFKKYGREVAAHDSIIINGREVRPPRFYDTRLALVDPERLETLKAKRRKVALRQRAENTTDRRRVREAVALARLNQKVKKL
ncbi:replication initiator protein [Blackfly microvirus SF02]|uniref:Replication initiator protein n=1 Tax=Blackfly microvirus SF02 TaxID=2576452 RepID=A0A4P8PJT5_9VIRU|nr:replication initiator protein [Blackfly microvirus SF02]